MVAIGARPLTGVGLADNLAVCHVAAKVTRSNPTPRLEALVAKKTTMRPTRVSGAGSPESRRARQVRQAPRPTATVPIESAAVSARPAVELPPSRAAQSVRPTNPSRINRPSRATSTLIADYSYVSRDLTRIATLAAVAFAVLIGLTFVIH